jgi:preprotein translocase subunit YajC
MESLGGLLFPLLILLLFIPIFLSGRKQRRQMQEQQKLQSALQIGDVVTTTSGLRGTVVDVSYEDTIDLEIADGVVTTWLRAAVRERVLDSSAADAPTSEIPASDDTVSDTPPSGTPVVAADQPALDGPVGTGARVDAESAPTVDAPRDANGTSRA